MMVQRVYGSALRSQHLREYLAANNGGGAVVRKGRSQELRAIIDSELGECPEEATEENENCDCEWGDDVSQVLKILNDKIDIAEEDIDNLDEVPAVKPYSDED